MDWQQPVSLAVVALTGVLFVRYEIRSRRRAKSRACGADCGCGAPELTGPEGHRSRAEAGKDTEHTTES